jgi:glycosyltransferase involved in cell wall biosynthesis
MQQASVTMSAQPLTLSVVICAYNEQDWIGAALASLMQQQRKPDEIIVVDNNSTDATAQIVDGFIAEHPDRQIVRVFQPVQGLHHAREAGWRAATSDIIVMTDADITFPANWLQIVEREFADSSLDAITGIIRYSDAHPVINWATWISDQLYQPEGIGKLMTREYNLTGGNSAYRRRVLESVNGYIDKPKEMLEDRYISGKVQSAGFRVRFVRHNKVWHTFRRYKKNGWRGYLQYIFFYSPENIWADHLAQE